MHKILFSSLLSMAALYSSAAVADPILCEPERGRSYALAGVTAPERPEIQENLKRLMGDKAIRAETRGLSRWQTQLARVTLSDGTDLALELIKLGWAQIDVEHDANIPPTYWAEEKAARENKLGLWNEDCCKVVTIDNLRQAQDSWRVVQGNVQSVTEKHRILYLNFGADWKKDFTVIVPAKVAARWRLGNLTGKNITVRGWVSWNFGPSITLSTPDQITLDP